ncbi:MAG: hypothetical protein ACRD4O_13730 [Bryobacteraceae bacterium]
MPRAASTSPLASLNADSVRPRHACAAGRLSQQHTVHKTKEVGWDRLANGELLTAAEKAGYDLFLTTDKNIRYQQNLAGRKISIIVLGISRWPILRHHIDKVVAAVQASTAGKYIEIEIPRSGAEE